MLISRLKEKIKQRGLRRIIRVIDSNWGIGRLERIIASNWFNPFATLWLNFRSLPFKQAVKIPIFVYGRPIFRCLSGGIIVEGQIKPGLIKVNKVDTWSPGRGSMQTEVINHGQIVFKGQANIRTGNLIMVYSGAELIFGNGVVMQDETMISCVSKISIGNNVSFAHRVQIMDSNFHYVANFKKRIISDHTRPIKIGDDSWIGNSCTISPGATLPDNTIVASNSLVNRSTNSIPENSVIGGIPAKVIGTDCRRVFNKGLANELRKYFENNSEPYIMDDSLDMEMVTKFR